MSNNEAGDVGAAFDKQVLGPRLFVNAILHDYMPTPSFAQGLKVRQVLDAALASHQTGERVKIDA